jgi:hypothetical protein
MREDIEQSVSVAAWRERAISLNRRPGSPTMTIVAVKITACRYARGGHSFEVFSFATVLRRWTFSQG